MVKTVGKEIYDIVLGKMSFKLNFYCKYLQSATSYWQHKTRIKIDMSIRPLHPAVKKKNTEFGISFTNPKD